MYGTGGRLIYAPEGARCAAQKGAKTSGPAAANPAQIRGCAVGNCKEGEGTYVWADGSRYSGGFSKGLQRGRGSLVFTNGVSHVGTWVFGKRSGVGTAIHPDGRVQAGRWKENRSLGNAATAPPSGPKISWPGLSRPVARISGGEKDVAAIVVVLDACFSGKNGSGEQLVAGLQPLVVISSEPASDKRTTLMTAAVSEQFAGPLPAARRPVFS
ncbi:MAG: hypothetical protein GY910_04060 [bacterium]|nr:hypothetical protein [Deltaproteobacteria bacterium]MCP4904134.1 hypothetical protein [bacterium]